VKVRDTARDISKDEYEVITGATCILLESEYLNQEKTRFADCIDFADFLEKFWKDAKQNPEIMTRSGGGTSFIVKDRNAFLEALKSIDKSLEQVNSPRWYGK